MHAREIVTSRAHPLVKRLRAILADGARSGTAALEGGKLSEEALAAGLTITECAVAALSEARTSQGILAIAERPAFDEDALFAGTPLLAIRVAIQNPGTVGALLRTAEAAGASGAYL